MTTDLTLILLIAQFLLNISKISQFADLFQWTLYFITCNRKIFSGFKN